MKLRFWRKPPPPPDPPRPSLMDLAALYVADNAMTLTPDQVANIGSQVAKVDR